MSARESFLSREAVSLPLTYVLQSNGETSEEYFFSRNNDVFSILANLTYVDVLAEFSKDGLLIPKEITWEDGRKYEITRVKDKRRAASTRAGGVGERYTCVVDGKEIFLFYEDNNMWFMERAGA